jgi:hypothetical protein
VCGKADYAQVLVHDAGHTGVTGDWWWDRVIGMTVASYIGGLSVGWWCDVSAWRLLGAQTDVSVEPQHPPS